MQPNLAIIAVGFTYAIGAGIHYMDKKLWTPDHPISMSLLNVQYQIQFP